MASQLISRLPPTAAQAARRAKIAAVTLLAVRPDRECPFCGNKLWFHPVSRDAMRCGRCGSLERHRRMLLFLRQTEVYGGDQPLRVLHIAPEECLRRELSVLPHVDYLTGDLLDDTVDVTGLDLTEIPFPNSSLNVLICSHVLEHILDDRRAMREMRRVLVPSGWALIGGPTQPGRTETYEDTRIVSPEQRLAHFGQEDHVRIYSRSDFIGRLEAAGFDVTPNPGTFTETQRRRYLVGDDRGGDLSYLCRPANT